MLVTLLRAHPVQGDIEKPTIVFPSFLIFFFTFYTIYFTNIATKHGISTFRIFEKMTSSASKKEYFPILNFSIFIPIIVIEFNLVKIMGK